MRLFYARIIRAIRARHKSMQQTADELNYFAKTKGIDTYIKPQNIDMWLKGSIPSSEYAKILELYLYEHLNASELLDILDIKEYVLKDK
jgi:hypothetical protein